MNVIVCGAGQVGFNIARHLAGENNNVTIIDVRDELIGKITEQLDIQGIVGYASHPPVLEQAGAADADMIIAVTQADEVNMVACAVAHALFKVPSRIARVRQQAYLRPEWADLFSPQHLPIDVIISPEIEVARAIGRRLHVPGAFDVIPLADDKVRAVGVRLHADCPVLDTPLRQLTTLFPELNAAVVGILRQEQPIVPSADEMLQAGDEVYFITETAHLTRAMAAFGHEEHEARRVIIIGGGNIGLYLAQDLEATHPGVSAKIIEVDKARAELVAQSLSRTRVLLGDGLDLDVLAEAGVGMAETIVTVTDDDEVNILASLLAKRYGCQRTVALINSTTYSPLMSSLGIDVVVSPRAITVSSILQHIRRGRIRAVHSLREGFGEIIEAVALETSPLIGVPLRDAKLPDGVIVGAIIRGDAVIIPRGGTVTKPGDRVVIFAVSGAIKRVERLFAVRLEYF